MAGRSIVPSPLAWPSDRLWFDPAAVGRSLTPQISTVTVPAGGAYLLAPADPARWAIGFMLQSGGGFNARVFPDPSVNNLFGVELVSSALAWFHLTNYGPFVSIGWWTTASPGAVVQVLEVIRVTKGV